MTENQLIWWASAVGNHLWQSTVFACVVWLMTLALRRNRAHLRYGLWVTSSLKFLLPFSLLLGIGNHLPTPHTIVVRNDQPAYSVATIMMHPLRPQSALLKDESEPRTTRGFELLFATATAIWCCGTVCVLAVWLLRWRRLRKTLHASSLMKDGREFETLRAVGGNIPLRYSRTVREPGIYGVFRSVLMWPEGLSNCLEEEHLTAIMTHEVAHVRHRDNLIAALHMVVEAVFWFHPLVWWLERKLLTERENVCDESVLCRLGNAKAYAFSLLKVSRFCIESEPPLVAGVTGADLRKRIVHIVENRAANLSSARALMLIVFGVGTFAIPLGLGMMHPLPMYGQVLYHEGTLPSFEVASVKLRPDGPPPTPAPQSGSTVHLFFTTKMLIMYAYNLPDFAEEKITHGPGWTDDTYDIEGKFSDTDYAAILKMSPAERQEQIQLRLQSLLKERFNLKVHLEKREQTIYALEIAKGGPKLSPAKHDGPDRFDVTHSGLNYELKATGTDMNGLASLLGRQPEVAGRSTLNRTGLNGDYDLTLRWTRAVSTAPDPVSSALGENGPSYFTAIQEQLGLRLSPAKGQVDYVVVDHIEKPSTN